MVCDSRYYSTDQRGTSHPIEEEREKLWLHKLDQETRPLKRTIQNLVLNPLAQMIIESKIKPEDRVKIDEKDGKIIITPMNKK